MKLNFRHCGGLGWSLIGDQSNFLLQLSERTADPVLVLGKLIGKLCPWSQHPDNLLLCCQPLSVIEVDRRKLCEEDKAVSPWWAPRDNEIRNKNSKLTSGNKSSTLFQLQKMHKSICSGPQGSLCCWLPSWVSNIYQSTRIRLRFAPLA